VIVVTSAKNGHPSAAVVAGDTRHIRYGVVLQDDAAAVWWDVAPARTTGGLNLPRRFKGRVAKKKV
jgi:hypothetical protein